MTNSVELASSIGRYCEWDFDVVLEAVERQGVQCAGKEFAIEVKDSLGKLYKLVEEFSKENDSLHRKWDRKKFSKFDALDDKVIAKVNAILRRVLGLYQQDSEMMGELNRFSDFSASDGKFFNLPESEQSNPGEMDFSELFDGWEQGPQTSSRLSGHTKFSNPESKPVQSTPLPASPKKAKPLSKNRKTIVITILSAIFLVILMGAMIYFSLHFPGGSHVGPHSIPLS